MSFQAYTSGIPNPNNDPSIDVVTMQTNSTAIANLLAVDHFGFNNNRGGWHNLIHMPPQIGIPVPVNAPPGPAGELYTFTNTGGSVNLAYQSNLGAITILTGNLQPVLTGNGYTTVQGGLILQWGTVVQNFPPSGSQQISGTTNFNTTFPIANFIVLATPILLPPASANGPASVNIRATTTSNFSWKFNNGSASSSYDGFFWLALGV